METLVDRFAGSSRQATSCRLKSNLTLDISRTTGNGIDSLGGGHLEDGLLSTPDVGLLKLATPELERLVLLQFMQQQQQKQQQQQPGESAQDSYLEPQLTAPQKRLFVKDRSMASAEPFNRLYCQQYGLSVGPPQQPALVDDGTRQVVSTLAGWSSTTSVAFNVPCDDGVSVTLPTKPWQQDSGAQIAPSFGTDRNDYTLSMAVQLSPSTSSACTSVAGSTTPPQPRSVCQSTAKENFLDSVMQELAPSLAEDFVVDDVTCGSWYSHAMKRRRHRSFDDDEDGEDSLSFLSRRRAIGVDTPPISPINMAAQERIKLERKRARNRQAATRCRNRKLERIATLQDQADRLRATNSQLASEISRLRETVFQLRRDISRHSAAGCQPMTTSSMSVAFPILRQQKPVFLMSNVVDPPVRCFESVF